MEEMIMMMTIRSPPAIPRIDSTSSQTTSNCPTWKLYENPFYYSQNLHHAQQEQDISHRPQNAQVIHRLHLPISARKIAASFWDLTFVRPLMESELEMARAQIMELKAELEHERKARKKLESMHKKVVRELSEEKKEREALEKVCEKLAEEISSDKAEMTRMKRDMEEERKMLRLAEVMREERVQMKLTEAKLFLEEKLSQLESSSIKSKSEATTFPITSITKPITSYSSDSVHYNEMIINNGVVATHYSPTIQRQVSPEPENPHIKRGIKGFVEFPKVVQAIGSKSRHLRTKLECQKAQLRILLIKQKSPLRSNNSNTNNNLVLN